MRLSPEQELQQLRLQFYRLINFILAAIIIGASGYILGSTIVAVMKFLG
jgi:hypothetical protein